MFTIKHVENSGHEHVYSAYLVSYQPKDANGTSVPETLWIHADGCPAQPLTGGRAYVMNDSGKTVATYDMRGPVCPQ